METTKRVELQTQPASQIITPNRISDRLLDLPWSKLSLVAVVMVAFFVHSYNLFGFPMYLGDEGIYMSQAYAVLKLGKIAPYTYFYDHAPGGWLLIALWSAITGGFHTFGTVIDGGRVLMLLLQLVTLVLLWRTARRLTKSTYIAIAVSLLYTLSPLNISISRMVLLDNIMIFWVMLATMLFLLHEGKLWPLLFSGFCFGVAVLTKENAILLLPAFTYGLWTLIHRHHARFARTGWLFATISTISSYFLFAALRHELIDFSLLSPTGSKPHSVSLIGAVLWQGKRAGGVPWDPSSAFFQILTTEWLVKDPWILGLGVAATLWNLVRGPHKQRLVGLLSILMILSIARGGPVLGFYVAPVLPLMVLNIALVIKDLANLVRMPALLPLAIAATLAISGVNLDHQRILFTLNMSTIQRQALAWIQQNVPPQAQLCIDDDLWVDLHHGKAGQPSFPNAHSHWKVANDPWVYHQQLHDDWRNINYLVLTPGLAENIFSKDPDKLPNKAYRHSLPVTQFNFGKAVVEIRKVNPME